MFRLFIEKEFESKTKKKKYEKKKIKHKIMIYVEYINWRWNIL